MTDWKKLEDELIGAMRRYMAALQQRIEQLEHQIHAGN